MFEGIDGWNDSVVIALVERLRLEAPARPEVGNTGVGCGDVHASVVSRIAIVSVTGSVHHVDPRPPSQP